jgi:hypothetical protein
MVPHRASLLLCTLWALCACGDDGSSAEPDAQLGPQSFIVADDSGVHHIEIHCDDLSGLMSRSYLSDGPHAHVVYLSADELGRIGAGETVETSFTEGHGHRFVIERPAEACVEL